MNCAAISVFSEHQLQRVTRSLALVFCLGVTPAIAEHCAISITSEPSGAEVFLNGNSMGLTPMTYMHGHPVVMHVKLVKKAHKRWEKVVDIGMNQILGLHAVLEPVSNKARREKSAQKQE